VRRPMFADVINCAACNKRSRLLARKRFLLVIAIRYAGSSPWFAGEMLMLIYG